ncbi:MAG TPA: dephospho-CoA kinase [Cryomorphaceae bacterium]|nr:dephospho-CoA kinase [Cryomorphaceae bacterium]
MIVGLTGGIGSGKSTVASLFAHLGVPIFEADAVSKQILDTDKELQGQLTELLGPGLVKDGRVNKGFMASVIFNDEELLQQVNGLIHPAVGHAFAKWYASHKSTPYVIREAAILFESGTYKDCDHIIVVSAPLEMRVERVMKRNHISREQVMERVNKQWPEEQKLKLADSIIYNDHSQSVIKQVLKIHENIIRQSDKGS